MGKPKTTWAKISMAVVLICFIPLHAYAKDISKIESQKLLEQESTAEAEKVLSLESLDKAETYEDLKKWGLVAPDHYNHKSGKNLILLALKSTSFFKGDWVAAYGLLGTSMIDVEVLDRIGYESLFLSLKVLGSKMRASHVMNNTPLLVDIDGSIMISKSIIARREAAIYSVSRATEARYIYDDIGNFARNYSPERNRKSNKGLRKAALSGLKIYEELRKMGFDDKTLRDTICMAVGSLSIDRGVSDSDFSMVGPLQVCIDALKATLATLGEKKNHDYDFLFTLGFEMQARGLATDDKILLPEDEKNLEAILKIVEKDLDLIKKK